MNLVINYLRPFTRFTGIVKDIETNYQHLSALGVDWNATPQCGLSGCSLKTQNSNIVKLSIDSLEYNLFKTVQGIPGLSGFVRIKYLEPLEHSFLMVKESIIPLHTLLEDRHYDMIADEYIDFMHVYYQEIREYELNRQTLPRSLDNIRSHLRKYGPKDAKYIFQGLQTLAQLGFKVSDIDPDNIGFTSDHRLVLFDGNLSRIRD